MKKCKIISLVIKYLGRKKINIYAAAYSDSFMQKEINNQDISKGC